MNKLQLFEFNDRITPVDVSHVQYMDCETGLLFSLDDKPPRVKAKKGRRSRKVQIGEHVFDSWNEARWTIKAIKWCRAHQYDYQLQVPYTVVTVTWLADMVIKIRGVTYAIDIKAPCKTLKVKDTKDKITQVARLKMGLIAKAYPNISVRIGHL